MKIYAISDLHLSATGEKPMEVFGFKWKDYVRKIKEDWQSKVTDEDVDKKKQPVYKIDGTIRV